MKSDHFPPCPPRAVPRASAMLAEGAAVRVWWEQDRQWHAGRVTQVEEDSGEFLVDYEAEDDGEAWVSTSHEWEAASSIVPSNDNPRPPQLTGLAVTVQDIRLPTKSVPFIAAKVTPFVPEDLDPFTDRVLIEERFTILYDEAVRLHGGALANPEAQFNMLLSSIENSDR